MIGSQAWHVKTEKTEHDALRHVHWLNLGLWLGGFLLLLLVVRPQRAVSFAFGGLLTTINFHALEWLLGRLLQSRAPAGKVLVALLYASRFMVLVTGIALGVFLLGLDPAFLAMGVSTILVAAVLKALWHAVRGTEWSSG